MNQAFFKRVLVTEQGVVGWEYNEPFATLMQAGCCPPTAWSEPGPVTVHPLRKA